MTRPISLAWLTTAPMNPVEMLPLARRIGYTGVGLRALPAAPGETLPPLLTDPSFRRQIRDLARQEAIRVTDMEIVRIADSFRAADIEPFLDLCADLSVPHILVAGDDADLSRLASSFADLCALAAPRGISPALEFMPWTAVRDARTALSVVTTAAADNGTIIVDTLHVARSGTTTDDLRNIPRDRLAYVQICDAPADIPATREGLIHTARQARLLPGDGGIDLTAILASLPPDLPVSVEIPNQAAHVQHGASHWASMAFDATSALLRTGRLA
ncbi:MAG: sugar phosphate isomerase/epimerase [Gluconacetobacter sp.]